MDAAAFTVFKAYLTDKQWQTFPQYFDYELVDEICEVTINYDAFELLLLNNPKALDDIWEFFGEVGIEGIHKIKDIQKLAPSWETAGKYIAIGSYVIDVHTFTSGVVKNDWGKMCSVPASWAGSTVTGVIIGSIEILTPAKWMEVILMILGGAGAGKGGKSICN